MEKTSIETPIMKISGMSPVIIVMGLGFVLLYVGLMFEDRLISQVIAISGLAVGLAAAAGVLYSYLRGSSRLYASTDYLSKDLQNIRSELLSMKQSPIMEEEFQSIKSALKEIKISSIDFSEEDKSNLLNNIKDSIEKNIAGTVIEEIESKYSSEMSRSAGLNSIKLKSEETILRLKSELDKLNRRAATNLAIGSITTVLAAALLAYMVLFSDIKSTDTMQTIVWHYVPRLSIIIFIEVFAFFFLRLYRENIHDSKYYQNEITNLDSKFIAFDAALISNDNENLKTLVNELSKTERNHILNKGETTVDLEREKLETQTLKDVIDSLAGIIKKK